MVAEKVAIGQAGGATSVMNASLFGFLEEALPDYEVYGMVNGLQGLAENRLVPLTVSIVDRYQRVSVSPGAWLGAGRWPARREDFIRYVDNLRDRDIRNLVLIGGNGTMWACSQLERAAQQVGFQLAVLGIPKTVDNDLAETDHAPGFGSAARYVATIVRDIGKDLESVRNFEAVRILETMGRNVGWLALSSGYLKQRPEHPPHLIYVPEREFRREEFLEVVKGVHQTYGYAVVVVSEGLLPGATENHLNRPVLGGVSRELAALVEKELGLPARGELLGMGQRSYSLAVSHQDWQEALALGREAAQLIRARYSGCMLAFRRVSPSSYDCEIWCVPFERVAGIERPLPEKWLLPPDAVHEEFQAWLGPLVGEDLLAHPDNLRGEP